MRPSEGENYLNNVLQLQERILFYLAAYTQNGLTLLY